MAAAIARRSVTFECEVCARHTKRGGKGSHKRRFCSKQCARAYWHVLRAMPDWPRGVAIPVELLRARRLFGQATWLLSDRVAYLRHNGGEALP
jgi:hypothetical protein